ncbi:MAG: hypothetical protein ACHQ16_04910, partial [Candidatus Lutacidiplasmatales archaeon]
STGANPAVPCPSYDPSEWANDTLSPWEIAPPVFFNSASRVQAAQVGFTQDLGGLAFIDGSDIFGSFPYTCLGHETSGFCGYPWYSYSCAEGAYNVGATDYGTSPTSVDFGKATEYGTRVTVNAAGLGYYPPGNHSVPTCGGTSSALTVINPVGGGSITFLNATIPNGTTTTFTNLTGGDYSLAAWAAPGYSFDGWRTGFGATVQDPADAYTDVRFTGGVNAVTLTWATGPVALGNQTNVTFGSATTGASFTVVPGYASETFGDGPVAGTMEVTAGTTVALAPGLYSIQAQPPPAYNFTGWTSSNQSAAWFSAPAFPVTILDVPVSSGQVDVNATFVASLSIATVIVFAANAADTVVLNGSNYSGFAVAVLPVGSYPISYVAGPGAQFSTWLGGGSEIMTNFSSTSRVTFEAGTSTIEASDYAIQLVTLNDSGGNGTIAWSPDTNWGSVAIPSGTTIPVNLSEAIYPRFTLVATPGPGEAFAGWTINNTALGFFANRMSYDTTVTFNSTGVSPVGITAHYVTGGRANLYVHLSPSAGAGVLQIGFAAVPVSSGSVPSATGNVYVVVGANSGFVVTGLTANNGSTVRLVQSASAVTRPWAPWVWVVDVAGNTSLNATFRTLTYPVTFVADWAGGSPTATINGSTVGQGDTVWLPNGTYSLSATLGSGVTFLSWSPSWSDLNVSAPGSLTTTFNVTGPGTLYALGSIPNGPIVVLSVLSPTSVNLRPGGSADVNATAYCLRGSCPSANLTFAWTLTNSAAGSLNVTTGAQVRFTAANVDANSELIVNATLNGTTVESAPASIAVVPALTGVTLTPSSGSIYAGQSVGIVPTLSCTANVTCPLGATITPSLGSPSLGFLGSNLTYPVTFTSYPGEFGTENISVQV